MKLTQRLSAAILAGSVLFFAASAQAELIDPSLIKPAFQLSQATSTNPANPGSSLDSNPDTSTGLTAPDSPAVSNPNTGNTTTVNPPTINNNITIPNPAPNTTVTQPNRSTTVTPPQTRVEVRNEAPALSQPAPAPNIDIDMPDAPDINVTIPGNTGTTDAPDKTVTERTERYIFNDTDDDDPAENNNILYMAVFGILAVFLIAIIAMAAARRRHLYVDDTTL